MPFRRIVNAYPPSRPSSPALVQKHTRKGSYIREIPVSSAAERKRKSLRTTPCEKLCVDDAIPLPVSIFQDAPWCLGTPERDLPSGGIFPEVQETPFEALTSPTSTAACENLRDQDLPRPSFPPPHPMLLPWPCADEPSATDPRAGPAEDTSTPGMTPPTPRAIDQYVWGRHALSFCRMSVDEFESLTRQIGWRAAGEVLLLAIDRKCGDNSEKWRRASALGTPWLQKRWRSVSRLRSSYNTAVSRSVLRHVQEKATPSGTFS